jgi:DNA-binding SARP family transcriptional activator
MFFRLLGPLEVSDANSSLRLGEGRQRSVLILLLLRRNEALPSDQIIDALWNGTPPPTAAKVLQKLHRPAAPCPRRSRGATAANAESQLRAAGRG